MPSLKRSPSRIRRAASTRTARIGAGTIAVVIVGLAANALRPSKRTARKVRKYGSSATA